ncbi:cholesterol 24-hydroxylase-like isoform X2 [Patiria miniata]|uniref:Cholesterol 24-hydroxylase n=1 Tax=Patiria miniata TaxID=46514 RepID=A0A914B9N5_PATMI|nr:cholesterol 24-hydroxylase-like isoform X2 [Patiria miniata]
MAVLSLTTCLMLVVITLVACIGLLLAAFVLFVHYQHLKYAHIPSPPRRGFFNGHMDLISSYKKRNMAIAEAFADIMRECGPVFHIFFYFSPMVVVLESDFVKDILCTSTHQKPSSIYRIFVRVFGTRFLGSGIAADTNPVTHDAKRALLNPAFHRKYLQGMMRQFNAGADVLIDKLSHKADGKTKVAMLDEFNRTTLDVIAKVAFGMDLKATRDDKSIFNQAITMSFRGLAVAMTSPMTEINPFPAARKIKNEVRESIRFLRETGRRCIEERLRAIEKQEEVPNDILTHILKEIDQLKGDGQFDMEGLVDEFLTFFIAGQETTANLLSFTLLELGHHPEIMHRLKTEVEAVLGDKEYLEYTDISQLTYMMQVFKEVLRLWPPVTGTMREMAGDVNVKGYKIPKGSMVMVNTYVMARMEEYFHDPLQFDPDRFKASDDKPQYAYFPFSLGRHNCIGQQFALIEARVLLARLLHKFNFDLVPGQAHEILDEVTLKPMGRCRNYLRLAE